MGKSYLITLAVSWVIILAAARTDAGPLDTPGAAKVLVCSACHGFHGNSPGNAGPILAGMAPS